MIFIKEESKDKGSIAASKHQHPAPAHFRVAKGLFGGSSVILFGLVIIRHSSILDPRTFSAVIEKWGH
jgi:hypothetical protein